MLDFKVSTLTQMYKNRRINESLYVDKLNQLLVKANYIRKVYMENRETVCIENIKGINYLIHVDNLIENNGIINVLTQIEDELITFPNVKEDTTKHSNHYNVLSNIPIVITDNELGAKFSEKLNSLHTRLGNIPTSFVMLLLFTNLKHGRTNLEVIKHFTENMELDEVVRDIKDMFIYKLMFSKHDTTNLPKDHILTKYSFRLFHYNKKQYVFQLELVPHNVNDKLPTLYYKLDILGNKYSVDLQLDKDILRFNYPKFIVQFGNIHVKEKYLKQFEDLLTVDMLISTGVVRNSKLDTSFVKEFPYVKEVLNIEGRKSTYRNLTINEDNLVIQLYRKDKDIIVLKKVPSNKLGEYLHVIEFREYTNNVNISYIFSNIDNLKSFLDFIMSMVFKGINIQTISDVLEKINANYVRNKVDNNVYMDIPIVNNVIVLNDNITFSKSDSPNSILEIKADFGEGNLQLNKLLTLKDCITNLSYLNILTGVEDF